MLKTERYISIALHSYLTAKIQTGGQTRHFFRLDGFDDVVYQDLLARLQADDDTLAGQPLWVRTTDPVPGYEAYALEEDKSATWYRNHVPEDHALVLIFNRRTTDAQSLKDIYPVTESLLVAEGLDHLIKAAFHDHQLKTAQVHILKDFIARLQRNLFTPQLRDLTEFLGTVNALLAEGKADAIEEAIAQALPHLGLFRCDELAQVLNTPRSDRLLRDLYRAARFGSEILEERQQNDFLDRLEKAEFDDESAFDGLSPDEKRAALRRFLVEVITDRTESLRALQLDWREVNPVLFKKARKTRADQLQELGQQLKTALEQQHLEPTDLPEYGEDVLQDLADGHEPDVESLDRLVTDFRDELGKKLSNKLSRLSGAKSRSHPDFITGLTALAVELLAPLQAEIQPGTRLCVTFNADHMDEIKQKEAEALAAFRALYGGIETTLSSVTWDLGQLWDLLGQHSDWQAEAEDQQEREKVSKAELTFRVAVQDEQGNDLAQANLTWQYLSDSPAAATLDNLFAERNRLDAATALGPLFTNDEPALSIPLYNTCPQRDDIGDLNLHRPRHSFGTWYETPGDLRQKLSEQLEHRAQPKAWQIVEQALISLERAWGRFVSVASTQGMLKADVDDLLNAYDALLSAAATSWQSGQEAAYGYRVLTQAWIVGPTTFEDWAVMPLMHPLKLHWWRERARRFNEFLADLLNADQPATIVDQVRFRRELAITFNSANFPAVLALPRRDGWPDVFLPVDEADGYELYRRASVAGIAYGLDPDLVAEVESDLAAKSVAEILANVVRDYIETYPFVQDGVEIYLMQCRNGALPGLLVERLTKLSGRRRWTVRISVVVHTTDRGAPLFQRVTEWLKTNEEFVERPAQSYFPPVTLKVLECDYPDLFQQVEDTDIVILPDVLAERGHRVTVGASGESQTDVPLSNYLPTYRAQQEPFERGEYNRAVLLTPLPQPSQVRHFYNAQWAAKERRPISSDDAAAFRQVFSLQEWEHELTRLHRRFNWVVCYDTAVDRFLLEDTFPDVVQVIRYSLGLGVKRRHNLTVSSSRRAQDVVIRRLTTRLNDLLPGTPADFRQAVAQRLVDEAKQVSGDIVLRAAGPGAYLNELIGLVVAKHLTEQRYLADHPGALTTWIYLDDFAHWFDRQMPDLLFVAIPPEANGELPLHLEVVETKCIGQTNFAPEAAGAQRQAMQGVNRLAPAWAPGAQHLDALYWYDQFYRAVVGNLAVERDQRRLWKALQRRLPDGDFTLDLGGHSWIFCHDGSGGVAFGQPHEDGPFDFAAPDAPDCSLTYHHYGRAGLRQALRELVEETWQIQAPPDTWSAVHDEGPPPSPEVEPIAAVLPTPTEVSAVVEPEPTPAEVEPLLQNKARDLERVLRQYKVQVYPVDPEMADVGPSIVRFKVRLRPGEQLNKLQRAANDMARELALTSVPIIDNVLGTRYVGIDLPRPEPELLSLLPALDALPQATVGSLPFLIGKTPDGRTIIHDLATLPHLLVAGTTGSGKTVFLYSLLVSLLHGASPDSLLLLLIDPKQTDFVYFEGIPHLIGGRVVIEADQAIVQLEQLMAEELPNRTEQLRRARCRDIRAYNEQCPDAPMRPLVVVIDEYAELIDIMSRTEKNDFESGMRRLAQRARNVGIHLVIATQRPSADIVTSSLKANLPARIAFRLPSHHDSMTVLDQSGAENLLGRGDMLFLQEGQVERLQGFFVGPDELDDFIRPLAPE
jgi:DNA segregation ATPase FtsK/SpoIIIE-like protein